MAGLSAAFAARESSAPTWRCARRAAPDAGTITGRSAATRAIACAWRWRAAAARPHARALAARLGRPRRCWNAGSTPVGRTRSGCTWRRAAIRSLGDPVYLRRIPAAAARPARGRAAGALLDFPRQALHAARLGFRHPVTGAALAFATPPPADMAALMASLDAAAGQV